ncbi:hypothetical protein AB1N83_003022 [Pleurotus pulmonarius]
MSVSRSSPSASSKRGLYLIGMLLCHPIAGDDQSPSRTAKQQIIYMSAVSQVTGSVRVQTELGLHCKIHLSAAWPHCRTLSK